MQVLENKTFDELKIGDHAEITRTLSEQDIEWFAIDSMIAYGGWGGSLVSAMLSTVLPGPGTIYVRQTLNFHQPVGLGDSVTVKLVVKEKEPETRHVRIDCQCIDQSGEIVIDGEAEVIAPAMKIRRPRALLPEFHLHERGSRFRRLIGEAQKQGPIRMAVVHPCDETSLRGALDAARDGLIIPFLVGPEHKVRRAAETGNCSLAGIELINVPHSHAAAERGVALARGGNVDALMKGALHTDELMRAVLKADTGLRTERRVSHIFALDVPHYPKLLFITDAGINIYPDLETKRDIALNAIELAHALGIGVPKVAILSAVETVNPKIPSTLDAAALCKMAERGQISGGLLDGPLAFDNAVSKEASRTKGIRSKVAGEADILITPDLEAGNMLAKQLTYLAGADAAGIALGARVPVVLTSRADGSLARRASCALAVLVAAKNLQGV